MPTFSSLDEQIAFIEDKLRLPAEAVTIEFWLRTLRVVAAKLPMNRLSSLRTIVKILFSEGPIECRIPSTILLNAKIDESRIVNCDRAYLACMECGTLPYSWQKAPRKKIEVKVGHDEVLDRVRREHLLLSRQLRFVLLKTEWIPHETWDGSYMETSPAEFWYEIDLNTIRVYEPSDADLIAWLREEDDDNLLPRPKRAFLEMQIAMQNMVAEVEGEYRGFRRRLDEIEQILSRIGR